MTKRASGPMASRIGWLATALVAIAACAQEDVVPVSVGTGASADALAGDVALDGSGLGDGESIDGSAGDAATPDQAATDAAGGDVGTAVDVGEPDAAAAKYPKCSQLLTCVGVACNSSSGIDCAQPCMSGASATSAAAIQPFLQCADQYCAKGLCAGLNDPKCLLSCAWQKCMASAMACGGDGKTGQATCTSAFGCMEGCKDKGGTCIFDCYAALSAAAQAQFDALGACAAAAGGKDAFSACPNQALTCVAGGKTGTDDCWKLSSCSTDCDKLSEGAKAMCIGDCWGKATKAAQAQWIAVVQCGDQSGGACLTPLVTCIAPSGTKTCLDTLGCWEACDKAQKGDACGFQCLRDATPNEGKKVIALMQCMADKCAACKGAKDCENKCLNDQCKPILNACLAP